MVSGVPPLRFAALSSSPLAGEAAGAAPRRVAALSSSPLTCTKAQRRRQAGGTNDAAGYHVLHMGQDLARSTMLIAAESWQGALESGLQVQDASG